MKSLLTALVIGMLGCAAGNQQTSEPSAASESSETAPGACKLHTDCPKEHYCANSALNENWVCTKCPEDKPCDCRTDSDCGPGLFCGHEGVCAPPSA